MANAIINFGYLWSFAFLILAVYFLLNSKQDLIEKLLGTTIFGNSFSLIFWLTTLFSKSTNHSVFTTPVIVVLAMVSILLLIAYITLIVILRVKPKKYYSSYPN